MGTEAAWIPLVLAAVGTGASVYNTKQTAKKTDNALARQIEAAAQKGREGNKLTTELVDKTAESSPQASEQNALKQYITQLQSANGVATAGIGEGGGASDRYNAESAEAALGVGQYGEQLAGTASKIDAPKRQRDEESFDRARTGSKLLDVERRARAIDFIKGLAVQKAGVRNPYVDAFSQLANGAAGSYTGGAGAGTAAAGAGAQNYSSAFFGNGGLSGIGW